MAEKNIHRKDFAMGKGKSIYSCRVLGNRKEESRRVCGGGKGFGKYSSDARGKQTKPRT